MSDRRCPLCRREDSLCSYPTEEKESPRPIPRSVPCPPSCKEHVRLGESASAQDLRRRTTGRLQVPGLKRKSSSLSGSFVEVGTPESFDAAASLVGIGGVSTSGWTTSTAPAPIDGEIDGDADIDEELRRIAARNKGIQEVQESPEAAGYSENPLHIYSPEGPSTSLAQLDPSRLSSMVQSQAASRSAEEAYLRYPQIDISSQFERDAQWLECVRGFDSPGQSLPSDRLSQERYAWMSWPSDMSGSASPARPAVEQEPPSPQPSEASSRALQRRFLARYPPFN